MMSIFVFICIVYAAILFFVPCLLIINLAWQSTYISFVRIAIESDSDEVHTTT